MLMNHVIIKPVFESGKLLFRVPDGVTLKAGDKVVCDTIRGDLVGICCCDSFAADPEIVMPLFGTHEKRMRYVKGRMQLIMFDGIPTHESEEKADENGQQESGKPF